MGHDSPEEILRSHHSKDLLIVVFSAILLLVFLQFPYRLGILRTLIIGFNIFIVLGYYIIFLPYFPGEKIIFGGLF